MPSSTLSPRLGLGALVLLAAAQGACEASTRPLPAKAGGSLGQAAPTASPASALPPATYFPGGGTALAPLPGPTDLPAEGRSLVDLPDDLEGPQIHGVYLLPADAPDEALDRSGALGRSLLAQKAWLEEASGGQGWRLDLHQGQPDVSFLRLNQSAGALRQGGRLFARLVQGLELAGFNEPHKSYAIAYGGEMGYDCSPGAKVRLGEASLGRAVLYLKACQEGKLGGLKANRADWTWLHEQVHALGGVAACAPHHQEGDHTQGAPEDLMAPLLSASPQLDPGRDDYFGHGRLDCFDLALSPFLAPPSAQVRRAKGWCAAGQPQPGQPWRPVLVPPPGEASLEQALERLLASQRQGAGLVAAEAVPPLQAIAREAARRQGASLPTDLPQLATQAGALGPLGASYLSLPSGAKEPELRAALAKVPSGWWRQSTTRQWGVGVVPKGAGWIAALVYGSTPMALAGAQWGQAPDGSHQLTWRVRPLAGALPPLLRLHADGQPQVFPVRLRAGVQVDLHFSWPAGPGAHRFSVQADEALDPGEGGQVRELSTWMEGQVALGPSPRSGWAWTAP